MRRSKDKDRPHRCSNCQQVGHRKDSSQCPFYDGPTTDKPQNASLAKYAPAYLEQSVRARTLVSLKQPSFWTARTFTEAKRVQKLQKLGMLPMLRKRHCWKCGRAFLRAGQMLRCGRCSVKYDNGMLPYSPLYTGPRHKPRDARMVLDALFSQTHETMDVIKFWTWMLSFLKRTKPWTSLGFGHGCSLFSNALDHGRH